jgi:hypothetical protein
MDSYEKIIKGLKDLNKEAKGAKFYSVAMNDSRNTNTEDAVLLDSIEIMLRRIEDSIAFVREGGEELKKDIMDFEFRKASEEYDKNNQAEEL